MSHSGSIIATLISRASSPARERDNPVERDNGQPSEEQEEEINDIFKLFDGNRDGRVTKFELKEALWSLGQHVGEAEVDTLFHEHDVNRSGALDCTEFRNLILTRLSYKSTRREFIEAFRVIDHDKDGSLNVDEIQRLMAVSGCRLTDVELLEIFGVFDRNRQGKIDIEEFVDYMLRA